MHRHALTSVFGPKLTLIPSEPINSQRNEQANDIYRNLATDRLSKERQKSPMGGFEDISFPSFSEISEGHIHSPLKTDIKVFALNKCDKAQKNPGQNKIRVERKAPTRSQLYKSIQNEPATTNVTVVLPSRQKKFVLHIHTNNDLFSNTIGRPQNSKSDATMRSLNKEISRICTWKRNQIHNEDSPSTNESQIGEATLKKKPFFIIPHCNHNGSCSSEISHNISSTNSSPGSDMILRNNFVFGNHAQKIGSITTNNVSNKHFFQDEPKQKTIKNICLRKKPIEGTKVISQNTIKTIKVPIKGIHNKVRSQVLDLNKHLFQGKKVYGKVI